MKERWRWVSGYEGVYKVSDRGRVRSVARTSGSGQRRKGRMLKLFRNQYGYSQSDLYRDGIRRMMLVSRIVAVAFIPNPQRKPQVNHKNGKRSDNRSENLEWATNQENTLHGFRTLGRIPWNKGKTSKH